MGPTIKLDFQIEQLEARLFLTPEQDHKAPVLCFSSVGRIDVVEGGTMLAACGGYFEIALPDLQAHRRHEIRIAFCATVVRLNRSWMPMGVYLRTDRGLIDVKVQDRGVRAAPPLDNTRTPPVILCPEPRRSELSGETIAVSGFSCDAEPAATVDTLARRSGLEAFLTENGLPLLLVPDESLPREGYRLTIGADAVTLAHHDRAGAIYGAVTLLTLRTTHEGQLPCGVIEDHPRFAWRGLMVDCGRHYFPVPKLLQILDLMALLKFNRFHWHFAEDEAFRLELASLPELADTHYRGEEKLLPGVFGGGYLAGGGYSRADAERVIAHAKTLNIEVMPEFEMPAHSLCVTKVYPETVDPLDTGEEISAQFYQRNSMNPAMPESWRVWNAMVDEISEIFPFNVIHIGGDELPEGAWLGSPAARQLMEKEGLETPLELQVNAMNRVADRLNSKGKTPAAWDEGASGQTRLKHDPIIFCWRDRDHGVKLARAGYRVVMTPAMHTYLDMAHSSEIDDWGMTWTGPISLSNTIDWDPVGTDDPQLDSGIIGVQASYWSEMAIEDDDIDTMILPRLLGVAMMAWQPRGSQDAATLHGLAAAYNTLLDAAGWQRLSDAVP